ncbi:MAG: hypothetical protein ACTTJK_05895 [Phocaeicola sp.]|uniref:hypothetical protein n=1 Tax=Phocaeicola sp. TaxID=2773926 RepID=UPI003FA0D2DE
MKKIIFLLFAGVILFSCNNKNDDFNGMPDTRTEGAAGTDIYVKSVKRGSAEWKAMSGEEKTRVSQIKEQALPKLTDEQLAFACINYPEGLYFGAVNNERAFIASLIKKFNGFGELMKRQYGVKTLIKFYKDLSFDVKRLQNTEEFDNFSSPQVFQYVELLLSDPSMMNLMDAEDLKVLEDAAWDKYKMKRDNPDIYGLGNAGSTLLLIATIRLKTDNGLSRQEREILSKAVNTAFFPNKKEDIEEIYSILRK